jgi:hypothetical protein
MSYLGFDGGGFDTVLVQNLQFQTGPFNPTGYEALAIDSISAVELRAVPGPIVGAGLPGLLFAGAGLLGWLHGRRNAATA